MSVGGGVEARRGCRSEGRGSDEWAGGACEREIRRCERRAGTPGVACDVLRVLRGRRPRVGALGIGIEKWKWGLQVVVCEPRSKFLRTALSR